MHEYTKYFKSKKGFDRFIEKLYEKYQSLGRFSGNIILDKLSKEEAETLSRLFGIDYKESQKIKISINNFKKIMSESKYEDFDINTLVEEYLKTTLTTKKKRMVAEKQKELEFYQKIINKKNTIGSNYLKHIIETKENPYNNIHKKYKKDKNKLYIELNNLIILLDNIPKENTLLPIFASNYTQDPHYLDLDKNHINLFIKGLCYINKKQFPKTREEKINILYNNNIEIDNISNFVITYNLLSEKKYINEFSKNKQTLILNLQNISNIDKFDTENKKVFIFENPSILTEIISKKENIPVIITGGFANLSLYLILDKLIKNKNKLYYNGDFDPEGLIIANTLKEKYKENLELFCYEKIDYENGKSNNKVDEKRIKKLSKVTNEKLQTIKKIIIETEKSAYQENNKKRIINYIKRST